MDADMTSGEDMGVNNNGELAIYIPSGEGAVLIKHLLAASPDWVPVGAD